MLKKFFFTFATAGLAIASAASYNVKLFQDTSVSGKQLKQGEYKLELKDNQAVLKHDKAVTEVPAKTETAPRKFDRTTVRYNNSGEIQEICIGGTTTKVVFSGDKTASGGGI